MTIGENIKNLRKKAGLTQAKLASDSNISRSYLADVENNRYNPSLETLKCISNSLGVQLKEILEDETDVNSSKLNEDKKLSPQVETIAAHLEEKAENITPHQMKMLKRYIDDLFEDFDD